MNKHVSRPASAADELSARQTFNDQSGGLLAEKAAAPCACLGCRCKAHDARMKSYPAFSLTEVKLAAQWKYGAPYDNVLMESPWALIDEWKRFKAQRP